jgi:hypothetical protein
MSHDRARNCTNPFSVSVSTPSTQKGRIVSSRVDANDHGRKRTSIATKSATAPADADLADVVDAWPPLPEAKKAHILAMVKAAVRSNDGGPERINFRISVEGKSARSYFLMPSPKGQSRRSPHERAHSGKQERVHTPALRRLGPEELYGRRLEWLEANGKKTPVRPPGRLSPSHRD